MWFFLSKFLIHGWLDLKIRWMIQLMVGALILGLSLLVTAHAADTVSGAVASVPSQAGATSPEASQQNKKEVRRAGILGGVAGKALLGTPAGRAAGIVLGRKTAKKQITNQDETSTTAQP